MHHIAQAAAAVKHCSTLCHQLGGFQLNTQDGYAGWLALLVAAVVLVGVPACIYVAFDHRRTVRRRRESTRRYAERQRASAGR